MTSIPNLIKRNAERWAKMHVSASRSPAFRKTAERLCAPESKARYQAIERATGVPWFIVAVIHEREAGGPPHWDKQLGQGDPLAHISKHDPKGRGPFPSRPGDTPGNDAFHRGAIDALTKCGPYASRWKDWTAGGALTLLEEYNGLGYAAKGVPSAYVWSGSDQYVSGKYVADHVYRAGVVDVQEGCAPIIWHMIGIDSSVRFFTDTSASVAWPEPADPGVTSAPSSASSPAPSPAPLPPTPAPVPPPPAPPVVILSWYERFKAAWANLFTIPSISTPKALD